MESELQEKVSYAMVQSMIAEGTGAGHARNSSEMQERKAFESFQKTRLSNVKSGSQRNQVPQVDAEDSIGKATEDFGGYSLGDEKDASGPVRLGGYEKAIEDSAGLDQSALKQRAALNINEAATPIHLSQGSLVGEPEFAQDS